ncbi:L10-interacting MYB domain-containing protein-like [Spinacia oleracea]|uniref:L10-interacting MYB domain-containing protein-like n=1 Tax=Spinacia oleracea TaxID=3562 RepID=A0A9R0K1W8_SPIOL|nr:L10-interacting MYB domain-containing protein-like [Spinacia oleracea]
MADSNQDFADDETLKIDGVEVLWTERLESYFVYIMAEEVAKGNMQSATFANAAWRGIAEALRQRTGKEYTYLQLKNKYHNLRARWSDFSNLLREKDIAYDSITGEVVARDDIWRKLATKYRRAKSFRKKGLKDYDKLCVIFGHAEIQSIRGDSSEGDVDTCRVKKAEKLRTLENPCKDIMVEKFNASKKQKLGKKYSFTPSLDSVADSGDGCGYQSGQIQDVVRCMEALNSLEGIDGASYVKVTRYIHDDPLWRKMFLCMPDERKKDWVLNI